MIILSDMIDSRENLSKSQHIYEKYKHTMYWVAFDIIKNKQDAEDIVAISLIKIIGILDTIVYEDIDRQRGKNLIITITKNTAIDYLRKVKKASTPCDYIEEQCSDKSTEELYIETENYKEVVFCIDQMDDKYRDVLRLKVMNHLSSKEIGNILNISEKSVNVRFMRAKVILSKKLKEHGKR